jgi:putative acetyltransferase
VGADDLDTVAEIQEASILTLGTPTYSRAQVEAWARLGWQYRHQLLRDDGAFFVAERPDRLVGVGGWSPDGMVAEIAWLRYLFVHPDSARQGVGRQLVGVIEADARGRGKSTFRVWSSLNAVGFYTALGYRRVRRGRWPVTRDVEIGYLLLAKDA